MKKRIISLFLAAASVFMLLTTCGCSSETAGAYTPVPGLDTTKQVVLKIAIPYETNKALNTVSNAFMTKYPNVSFHLQYVEDYETNAVRLFKDNAVDIILQKDVQFAEYADDDKTTDDYYYDFIADAEINLSNTTPDISDNYRHTKKRKQETRSSTNTAIPWAAKPGAFL